MVVLETERLVLRRFKLSDADFILKLLNEPSWIENIGDRKVRTLEDARGYLQKTLFPMYEEYGYGFFLVKTKSDDESIGLCGLIKRETLDNADLGFAFLPNYWNKGFAFESVSASVDYAKNTQGMPRIFAITLERNTPCIKVLLKLGFAFREEINLNGSKLQLYSLELNI